MEKTPAQYSLEIHRRLNNAEMRLLQTQNQLTMAERQRDVYRDSLDDAYERIKLLEEMIAQRDADLRQTYEILKKNDRAHSAYLRTMENK